MPHVVRVSTLGADAAADATAIAEAAEVLRAGGLVAFPTETVYGLGALARSADAVAGIFAAKGRPADDPLIVHVLPEWSLDEVFAEVDELMQALIDAHWPGPLTIVAAKHSSIPDIVTAGGATVAVRAPAHPVAMALLEAVGAPVAAPSANRFSYVSATTADHVVADLGDAVDLVLDGGPATAGIESTVIAVEPGRLTVLRHGALTIDDITSTLGVAVEVVEPDPESRRSDSPGRLVRHYAPATVAIACPPGVTPPSELPGRVCFVGYEGVDAVVPAHWVRRSFGRIDDLAGVAEQLYANLRSLDAEHFDTLVLSLTERPGLGAAIDDRLRRSASGRILEHR